MAQARNYGIDYLRIAAAWMVIVLHLFTYGNFAESGPMSTQFFINTFMRGITIVAVNLFALCSGYCNYGKRFKLSGILNIWLATSFYSVSIKLIFSAINNAWNVSGILKAFLPVSFNAYWYITSYVLLFFTMPLLNVAVEHLEKQTLETVLCAGVILFGIQGFITHHNYDIYHANTGLSAIWLMYMYLIGAYAKKYPNEKLEKHAMILYLLSTGCMFLCGAVNSYLFFSFRDQFIISSYNFLFNILSAVSLFYVFLSLGKNAPKSERVRKWIVLLSKHSLAVYIINCTKELFGLEMNLTRAVADMQAFAASIFVLLFAGALFIGSVYVDVLREKLFQLLHIDRMVIFCDEKLIRLQAEHRPRWARGRHTE